MIPKGPNDLTKWFGTLRWFVIHTKPRDEHRVKNHFRGMEIETLLPLCESFRYVRGQMYRVVAPLFPNYLFARLDLEQHYYKVKWTRGVGKILGVGNEPSPVSEAIVQTLKDRMREDDTVELSEDIKEGDLVQITSGPLKDFVGVFQKGSSSQKRVKILLTMIGVDVPVQISRLQIKRVT